MKFNAFFTNYSIHAFSNINNVDELNLYNRANALVTYILFWILPADTYATYKPSKSDLASSLGRFLITLNFI